MSAAEETQKVGYGNSTTRLRRTIDLSPFSTKRQSHDFANVSWVTQLVKNNQSAQIYIEGHSNSKSNHNYIILSRSEIYLIYSQTDHFSHNDSFIGIKSMT